VGVEAVVGVADSEGVMIKEVGELPTDIGLLPAVFVGRGREAEGDAMIFEGKTEARDKGPIEIRLITARPTAKTTNTALKAKERQARATYSRRKRKFAKRRLACKARIPKK
jgi:hypothetical protein